ncbi:MAG: arginine N-succinyltransferase [Legionellales bacterium]|nr:arginine N-succinyltransferase [Legionellales bacterium]
MMLFRAAIERDLESIHELALASGVGLTTLPKDRTLLKKRLTSSINSFKKKGHAPSNEYYLFVLVCPIHGKVVGTSAIEACTGHDAPFYSFQLSKEKGVCSELNLQTETELLTVTRDNEGRSELCTLFLDPTYRIHHNGLLLIRARFLFMSQFKERFKPRIIAELRGVSDSLGHSPFFDHVSGHFLHMPFSKADELTLSTKKKFIHDLMPKHPIYVPLIAPAAQAVIGKPHPATLPAMTILLKEGFYFNQYVDIFDAGPTLEAPLNHIKTASQSRVLEFTGTRDEPQGDLFIVANTKEDFRATLSKLAINLQDMSCELPHETVDLLQLKPKDHIRISPLRTQT